MTAFYNEIDAAAADSIREVLADGLIAPGRIDTRSIKDVTPDDLREATQAHFFAGAGAWSYAARLAGWPDTRPLWTGSCPCQPFSQAGKRAGFADERHLWPDFHRLIGACRPAVVVGEQVSGAAGYAWLDGVCADLEREGYTCEAFDIPAAAVDAPHIRQRLYWAARLHADADRGGRAGRQKTPERQAGERAAAERDHDVEYAPRVGRREGRAEHELRSGRPAASGADAQGVGLADAEQPGLEGHSGHGHRAPGWPFAARSVAEADGSELDDPYTQGRLQPQGRITIGGGWSGNANARRNGSFWSDAEWLDCHDGKRRRSKPGLRLLVTGRPGRISQWRIAGNQICIPLAVEFLKAVMEWLDEKDMAR